MTCRARDDHKEDNAPGLATRRAMCGASDDDKEDNTLLLAPEEEEDKLGHMTMGPGANDKEGNEPRMVMTKRRAMHWGRR